MDLSFLVVGNHEVICNCAFLPLRAPIPKISAIHRYLLCILSSLRFFVVFFFVDYWKRLYFISLVPFSHHLITASRSPWQQASERVV